MHKGFIIRTTLDLPEKFIKEAISVTQAEANTATIIATFLFAFSRTKIFQFKIKNIRQGVQDEQGKFLRVQKR